MGRQTRLKSSFRVSYSRSGWSLIEEVKTFLSSQIFFVNLPSHAAKKTVCFWVCGLHLVWQPLPKSKCFASVSGRRKNFVQVMILLQLRVFTSSKNPESFSVYLQVTQVVHLFISNNSLTSEKVFGDSNYLPDFFGPRVASNCSAQWGSFTLKVIRSKRVDLGLRKYSKLVHSKTMYLLLTENNASS